MPRKVGDKNKSRKHSKSADLDQRSIVWKMTKRTIDRKKEQKAAEQNRYNSLCGPITITHTTIIKRTIINKKGLNQNRLITLN